MTQAKLRLYHYWRSTSSWRVRWAFAHKKIPCEWVAINLLADDAESPEHRSRNPMGYVPVVEFLEPGSRFRFLGESVAIIEWAEEAYPEAPLLPRAPLERARVRQLSELINAGVQPLQNLNVQERHSPDPTERKAWTQEWIRKGLGAYEALVKETAGKFSFGDALSMAELFLIPQCYAARRNEIAVEDYPVIARIEAAALATESGRASHPDRFAPAK